ncbi:exosome component 4 [Ramicandelaber brevisporus]|nr:exosome component 4 [Ramicandelaber brevisporus]
MSRVELLSPEGLRSDGRRANELRNIVCRAGTLRRADGSAYLEQGNTKVLAAIHGPHAPRSSSSNVQPRHDRAVLNVEVLVAPFSGTERKRWSRNDKRASELAQYIVQTFEASVFLGLYPRSVIDIHLHILQQDGGLLETCINAASLALVDAGIAVSDMAVAVSAGCADMTKPLLDLNGVEANSFATPVVTVAILPRTEQVVLMTMESRLAVERLKDVVALAVGGCKHIHGYLDGEIRARTVERLENTTA